MLQGFLSESAMVEIKQGLNNHVVNDILTESITALEYGVVNEGVTMDKVKDTIKHIISIIMTFFDRIKTKINQLLSKPDISEVANIKKTVKQFESAGLYFNKEITVNLSEFRVSAAFNEHTHDVTDILKAARLLATSLRTSELTNEDIEKKLRGSIDGFSGKLITKIKNKVPTSMKYTDIDDYLGIVYKAQDQLKKVSLTHDTIINMIKSDEKSHLGDSDEQWRIVSNVYNIATKVIMQITANYTTFWSNTIISYSSALGKMNAALLKEIEGNAP